MSDRAEYSLTEAWVRVRQAFYALSRFREIEARSGQRAENRCADLTPFAAAVLRHDSGAPELEFYAESFYQAAYRAWWLLRREVRASFTRFDATGVCGVRRWLVAHGEDSRGTLNRNYIFDVPEGFIIKPYGGRRGRFQDAGLYPNAREFVGNLLAIIEPSPSITPSLTHLAT